VVVICPAILPPERSVVNLSKRGKDFRFVFRVGGDY
jgi:hypothetical protein